MSLRDRLLRVLQPPLDLSVIRGGPLEWPGDLMPFQIDGIRVLLERDRLLLADEMGLGKTIQALAALRLLTIREQLESTLIVVPASVFGQWREQFRRWAPELRLSPVRGLPEERALQWRTPAHAHLVSYETLRADSGLSRQRTWDLVIIDEAQRIKNADAEVAHVVKQVLRKRAWALTGTPLENRLEDLASVLEFVRPRTSESRPSPMRADPELRQRLSTLQLRRRKREVLPQLPRKTLSEVLLSLSDEQREAYKRAEQEGLVHLRSLGTSVSNVLELILRLKQICNFAPDGGSSAKADDLEERLAALSDSGERALIFSQFADDQFGVAAIAARLAAFHPLTFTGRIGQGEREDTLQEFKNNPKHKALILSLRAGGLGLNLQEASYVFHFDRWWNPSVENQATDRSHRLGQPRPVHVYAYTIEDSIEQRILEILEGKQLLFDEIVEGVGIDVGRTLTGDELFRLVGVAPPAGKERSDAERDGPLAFELRVGHLLERQGYAVEFTEASHDGGIDIIATRLEAGGLADSVLYVQCKSSRRAVGVDVVRELVGALPVGRPGVGVVACHGGFSREAIAFARLRGVRLWGPDELGHLDAQGPTP